MSLDYSNHFNLYEHNEAVAHSATMNVGDLQDKFFLKLPNGLAKYLTLTKIESVGLENNGSDVDIEGKVEQETGRIWIIIDKGVFDVTVGFHMYRLIFEDSALQTERHLYFCYHIQDNAPEKPYIYMNREGT